MSHIWFASDRFPTHVINYEERWKWILPRALEWLALVLIISVIISNLKTICAFHCKA